MQWFEINVKGLANIIKREGLPAIGRELIQNAFDVPKATQVKIRVSRDSDTRIITIECVDNGSGFEKLADAWTLFNPSIKAGQSRTPRPVQCWLKNFQSLRPDRATIALA